MSNSERFIPDTSHYTGDQVDWASVARNDEIFGAILKATEGVSYQHADWFTAQWAAVRKAGEERAMWLRGAYHYLIFHDDPAEQADYFVRTIEAADNVPPFGNGDIMPIVDVELGKSGSVNHDATKHQVIDCVTAFVEQLKSRFGCHVMLYGHNAMATLNITDRMGCDKLWMPAYTATMTDPTSIGWEPADVALWQYTDGDTNKTEYPSRVAGLDVADVSVILGDFEKTYASL